MNSLEFKRAATVQNGYIIKTRGFRNGSYKISLIFDISKHNLKQYFIYQNKKNKSGKWVFSNMSFSNASPGIRFGPWPGWRIIPELPEITLIIGQKSIKCKYYFYGDEEKNKILRAFANLTINDNEYIDLQIKSNEFILKEANIYEAPNITPCPVTIKTFTKNLNCHPNLIFDNNELQKLRLKINTKYWRKFKSLFDNWNLEWKISPESKILEGKERLNILDKLIASSFFAIITENSKAINRAIETFIEFINISSKDDYEPLKIDTQCGECLFNLCVAFDWLYNYLTAKQKEDFSNCLKLIFEKLKKFLYAGRDDFAQAHFLGISTGLLAYSFLFYNEETKKYIVYLSSAFKTTMNMLPEDGSFPHGINLWIYEYNFLVRITELLFRFTNQNYWKRKNFWRNSSLFRQYAASFDLKYGITFGDPQYRTGGDAFIHYIISKRINNKEAFNFAEKLADQNISGIDFRNAPPRRRVWEYIYSSNFDIHSKELVPFLHFKDTGQIFIKNNKNRILFTIKAGYPLGIKRRKQGEWGGYGHSDPCNGSFLIYNKNDLIICGPESSYKRDTSFHNTITINNYGQLGDKMVWAPDFIPDNIYVKIDKIIKKSEYYYFSMDLTKTYLDFLKVKLLKREFIFFKSNILFGIDTIETDERNNLEWNIHTYGKYSINKMNNYINITGVNSALDLHFINNIDKIEKGYSRFVPAYPNPGKRDKYLKFIKYSNKTNFIYCFAFNGKSGRLKLKSEILSDNNTNYYIDSINERWKINFSCRIKNIQKVR